MTSSLSGLPQPVPPFPGSERGTNRVEVQAAAAGTPEPRLCRAPSQAAATAP